MTFVENIATYEDAKIRVLNGGHTVPAYQAALMGIETFDDAMKNEQISSFFDDFEGVEVITSIGDSVIDLHRYREFFKKRFGTARIGDTVARNCMDGAGKFSLFVYPTLIGYYRNDIVPEKGLDGVASWYIFTRHVDAGKVNFNYVKPLGAPIKPMYAHGKARNFACNKGLWNELPDSYPAFVDHLVAAIMAMQLRFPIN